MGEYTAVLAKTGVVQQRDIETLITREALQSLVDQLNMGRSTPFIVEHDPTAMPIGKVTQAWLEPSGTDWIAKGRVYVERSGRRVTHTQSGDELVYLDFKHAPEPFTRRYEYRDSQAISVGIDSANFANIDDYLEFKGALERIDSNIAQKDIGRHSAIPEPLIEFVFSYRVLETYLTLWLLRRATKAANYVVDETLKKAADQLVETIGSKISKTVRAFREHQAEVNAPVVNQLVIPGEITLVLLISLDAGEVFPGIDLKKLTTEIEKYGDLLGDAEEARFSWSGDSWKFLYMKTRSGQAIGTAECFDRTLRRLGSDEHQEAGEDVDTIPPIPGGVSIGGLTRSDVEADEDEDPSSEDHEGN